MHFFCGVHSVVNGLLPCVAPVRWSRLHAALQVQIDMVTAVLEEESTDVAPERITAAALRRLSEEDAAGEVSLSHALEQVADQAVLLRPILQNVLMDVFGGPRLQADVADMDARIQQAESVACQPIHGDCVASRRDSSSPNAVAPADHHIESDGWQDSRATQGRIARLEPARSRTPSTPSMPTHS